MTRRSHIQLLLRLTILLSLPLSVYPFVLHMVSEAFPGRLLLTIVFVGLFAEKLWSTVWQGRRKVREAEGNDWTAAAVGLAYVALLYGTITEFHLRQTGPGSFVVAVLFGVCYLAAVVLRYWAMAHLGDRWTVSVDRGPPELGLVATGPYRFVRHPIYLGACVEAVSLPLMFWAPLSALFAALVFVPLELYRAAFEERHLRRAGGGDYEEYARQTGGFLPARMFGRRRTRG